MKEGIGHTPYNPEDQRREQERLHSRPSRKDMRNIHLTPEVEQNYLDAVIGRHTKTELQALRSFIEIEANSATSTERMAEILDERGFSNMATHIENLPDRIKRYLEITLFPDKRKRIWACDQIQAVIKAYELLDEK